MVDYGKAIRRLWSGKCDVIQMREKLDPVTHRTEFTEVLLLESIPCRLSFSTVKSAGSASPAATAAQSARYSMHQEIPLELVEVA